MNYYSVDIEKIYSKLNTNKDGLPTEEVTSRLNKYGKNEINDIKKESKLVIFFKQFKNLLLVILLLSGLFSIVLSYINKESYIDGIIIIVIVIVNCLIDFFQEIKASNAVEELKEKQVTTVLVKRDGIVKEVDSKELVKGDIILLEAGSLVPADARIIKSTMLKVDESCLTGESIDIEKNNEVLNDNTILACRTNMLYQGTIVTYGKATVVVIETGMNTELGKIAASLSTTIKNKSPLEIKLEEISKALSYIIFGVIVVMFLIGLIKGIEFQELIILSISLAVAAIPESLPTVITIVLSLGVLKLSKKNAIVKENKSIETLGCTEIICTDKTGTITENKMSVEKVYFNNKIYDKKDKIDKSILSLAILNSDVYCKDDILIGESTEVAIYNYINSKNINIDKIKNNNTRINEIPFDSNRKMMSTFHINKENNFIVTKGSFDSIIDKCKYIKEEDKIVNLTKKKKEELRNIQDNLSKDSYRVLTYAYKDSVDTNKMEEKDLIFLMMFAIIDPPRKEVKKSIKLCKDAGIRPIMITGDSLETAKAIAKSVGILEHDDEAISGVELDKINKEELKNIVDNFSVYARVSPENKLDIVSAWQENNKTVAFVGDGVNDSPAIKKADIGIGMGITGSDVSKEAADLIILDDSFSTIVTSCKEGRIIYDNIKNVLLYLLTGNIAEILVVLVGILFGVEIFIPIQLLYINLVTDSIPAISLSFEKGSKDVMNKLPRSKEEGLFTKYFVLKMILSSLLKTSSVLLVYFINISIYNVSVATTMAFLTLILLEIVFAYSCKNIKEPIINKNIFTNKHLNKSTIYLLIIQLIIFITPIKHIFNITTLSFIQCIYVLFIVLICYLIDEFSKVLLRDIEK